MSTIIGQLPGESFEVLYNRIGAIILSDEITSLFIIWGGGWMSVYFFKGIVKSCTKLGGYHRVT